MPITIKLTTQGTGYKVEFFEGGLTVVHYFDDYHKAVIKAAVLRVKYTKGKLRPLFINEANHVSTA